MHKTHSLIREMLQRAELPHGQILCIHSRIKNLMPEDQSCSYADITKWILDEIEKLYAPKTILVPTYTYSFTKNGLYDRARSPSEVGRFSEESRLMFPSTSRTLNPVFSHVDSRNYFGSVTLDETSAFGAGSLMDHLHQEGHVILNIDVPKLFGSYLHFLESKAGVPYRFDKLFEGTICENGNHARAIKYRYYVRNMDLDTKWRREKVRSLFEERGIIHDSSVAGLNLQWLSSQSLDAVLLPEMQRNPCYLIQDP